MALVRTDIHRPGAIIPQDYDYVGQEVFETDVLVCAPGIVLAERARIQAHMGRTGGTYSDHDHGGNCMVCGAAAIYTVLFHHRPSNVYIRTGQDCAIKMELGGDERDFNAFRAAVHDARLAQAGKKKAQAILTDAGLAATWQYAEYVGGEREEGTIRDIVSKLVQYGSLSEKQLAFLRTLLDRIATRAERLAQRQAETDAAAPCPTGRVDVSGVILSTKVVASDFSRFGTLKMLLKADAGFKVWGTIPAALNSDNFKVGTRVTIRATVTPSKDDLKFGFFKRPILLTQPTKEAA